jgi:uncharacterized protein YkwD
MGELHIGISWRERRPDMTHTLSGRTSRTMILLAVAVVGLLAAGLLAPAHASAATFKGHTTTKTEKRMQSAVLWLLNGERRAHHLAPLTSSKKLVSSARTHNKAMTRANTLSHQLKHESGLARRIDKVHYSWQTCGENIGVTSSNKTVALLALESAMYNEKAPYNGHRLNILSHSYKNVGVSVYNDPKHHRVWLTVDFGRH